MQNLFRADSQFFGVRAAPFGQPCNGICHGLAFFVAHYSFQKIFPSHNIFFHFYTCAIWLGTGQLKHLSLFLVLPYIKYKEDAMLTEVLH